MTNYEILKIAFGGLTDVQLGRMNNHLRQGHELLCSDFWFTDESGYG